MTPEEVISPLQRIILLLEMQIDSNTNQGLHNLLAEVQEFEKQDRWIPVDEGLPEIYGRFIVALQNGSVMEMQFSPYGPRWWKIGIGDESSDNPVMFWRNLPLHPNEFQQGVI